MEYIIISTWNGDGYSYTNKAEVVDFELSHMAQLEIASLIASRIMDNPFDVLKVEMCLGYITYDDGANQGTFQWIPRNNAYGIEILCNINDVRFHDTKEDYDAAVELAKAQAEADDIIEDDNESPFIAAYNGDYDHQFIKL